MKARQLLQALVSLSRQLYFDPAPVAATGASPDQPVYHCTDVSETSALCSRPGPYGLAGRSVRCFKYGIRFCPDMLPPSRRITSS